MGQSSSREYYVVSSQPKKDYVGPIVYLIVNVLFVGFLIGIFFQYRWIIIWNTSFNHGFHIYNYLRALLLLLHIVSWYIVFAFVYLYIIEVIIQQAIFQLISFRFSGPIFYICQLLFGLWMEKEILGGWIDLERSTDCLLKGNCQGYFLERFMYLIESICNYFGGYDYNEMLDIYIHSSDSFCNGLFHFMPHVLTTIFSCTIATVCILLAAP